MITNSESQGGARVFAYCHDGVGIGHLSRTMAICNRISREQPNTSFLVATGTPYASLFEALARTDYIKLPALVKANTQKYSSKFFSLPSQDLMRCRSNMLLDSIKFFDPTFVLVDKAPLGVCGELLPALEWLKENRPNTRIIFGMRDIEDSPSATIEQWNSLDIPIHLAKIYHEIWVYGMQQIFDVREQYHLTEEVRAKIQYMGYVTPQASKSSATSNGRSPFVLATVGGGTDGDLLLDLFLSKTAKDLAARGMRSVVVAGPDFPKERYSEFQARARAIPSVEWIAFDQHLSNLIRDAELVVSMGGYNTLCEIAAHQKRALVVPRVEPRKEQLMRARLWQERGVIQMLEPDHLDPQLLSDRVLAMLESDNTPRKCALDLCGLDRVAARFNMYMGRDTNCATALHM